MVYHEQLFVWATYFFDLIGISSYVLKFPDFIFYLIIPFVISVWSLYLFMSGLQIFRFAQFVNAIFAVVVTFVLLRFIYPVIFIISLGYIILIKKWPSSLFFRIIFIALIAILYLFVLPYLSAFTESLQF